MKRKLFVTVLCAVLAVGVAFSMVGCSSGKEDTVAKYDIEDNSGIYYSRTSDGEYVISSSSNTKSSEKETTSDDSRKLVKTYEIYAESKEFDSGLDFVDAKLKAVGGYYESKSVTNNSWSYYSSSMANRTAYFVFRVPVDAADEFIATLKGKFNFTRLDEQTKDVTLSYSDTESHLEALRAQEKRLVEMMATAETLADLITIDDKLTDVRYEIENYEKQIRDLDNRIEYVSIDMTLREVAELSVPETDFWTELWNEFLYALEEFGEGWKEFFIWFVSAQPTLLVLGGVGLAIFFIIRGIVKKAKKNKTQKEEKAKE